MSDAPNAVLQERLRKMIYETSIHEVSVELGLSRYVLLRYLSGLGMSNVALRGVESTLERELRA